MAEESSGLNGARVLVLEDDYLLATDLQLALEAAGVTVIGPFGDEAHAGQAVRTGRVDCAFIDVNLGAGPTFKIPVELASQGVPFAFVTGYDDESIPKQFGSVPRFKKPIDARKVLLMATLLLSSA